MLQRILVPLDGSELAEGVIPAVAEAARRRNSELLLLTVVDADPDAGGSLSALAADLRGEAERYLKGAVARFANAGLRIRRLIRSGAPGSVIPRTVVDEQATMIAMTSRGRTGTSRWSFGHVVKSVLGLSPVPLFVHPGGDVRTAPLDGGAFLVPVDCTKESLDILPPVAELAQTTGSTLRFLSACAVPEGCEHGDLVAAESRLRGAADRARSLRVGSATRLLEGDAATIILDESRTPGTALVAMATHAWRNRSVFRSVTEKVLSAVKIPMLVVRSHPVD